MRSTGTTGGRRRGAAKQSRSARCAAVVGARAPAKRPPLALRPGKRCAVCHAGALIVSNCTIPCAAAADSQTHPPCPIQHHTDKPNRHPPPPRAQVDRGELAASALALISSIAQTAPTDDKSRDAVWHPTTTVTVTQELVDPLGLGRIDAAGLKLVGAPCAARCEDWCEVAEGLRLQRELHLHLRV